MEAPGRDATVTTESLMGVKMDKQTNKPSKVIYFELANKL